MADPEIRALLDRRRWEQAFEMLVADYQSKVFRLAYSILGNRARAEDAEYCPMRDEPETRCRFQCGASLRGEVDSNAE